VETKAVSEVPTPGAEDERRQAADAGRTQSSYLSMFRKWRRSGSEKLRLFLRDVDLGILIVAIICFLVLLIALWLPEPETMVTANLRSETIAITDVPNTDDDSFQIFRARLGRNGRCLRDVTVRPASGSSVIYTRRIGKPLLVISNSTRQWWLDASDKSCPSSSAIRLPVVGPIVVGTDSAGADAEPQMPVLKGTLDIYARAVDSVGPLSLQWIEKATNAAPHTFFHVETLELPAGAVLGYAYPHGVDAFDCVHPGDVRKPKLAPWRGFVDVDLSKTFERGMMIEASTNASTIKILNPAPPSIRRSLPCNGAEPDPFDVVSLKLEARLLGDPNLKWLLFVISVLVTILGIALQFFGFMERRKKPGEHR
jgi:hypothetical protein